MRAIVMVVALVCLAWPTVAQEKKFKYCDLFPMNNVHGKTLLYGDFGNPKEVAETKLIPRWMRVVPIIDEATGKPKEFFSPMEAINYMAADGWELVNVYPVKVVGTGLEVRYVMKKPIDAD